MFSREWAMPAADTFAVKPIAAFVQRYLANSRVSVDPFARNNEWATWRNDLDPQTRAPFHMDAEDFLVKLASEGVQADLAIMDPPYSPRQVSEHYRAFGRPIGKDGTQTAALYARVRRALKAVLAPGGVVLSFGWNSCGMGQGFKRLEYLLVAHGGAHNDTICIAEQAA